MTRSRYHELDIEIDPSGKVKVWVKGAKGKQCLEYIDLFEDILGGKVEDKQLTSEYYEQPVEVVTQKKVSAQVKRSR
ncbi:MAG: DUF2997 domain-containing protein [Armatimonadetes bacterium]|nr:DUF2997 domain-containing protein [Armatimonadota bacterium]MDW8120866.1 DUF2997 domain-containing protein [Armatimonadota bacterium]